MKICQINCIYGVGSTGKIVRDIHLALLEQNYDSIVICPESNQFTKEPRVNVISNKLLSYSSAAYRRLTGRQYDGAFLQTSRILSILEKEQPDIVHLHCINGNNINVYRLLNYLAENKIKTIFTLHAEFPYTGGCGHAYDCEKWKTGCGHCPELAQTQSVLLDKTARTWSKWKTCYDKFDADKLSFTAVSPWLADRAKQSPMIGRFPIFTVMNPVDTKIFCRRENPQLRKELGIREDEKILLHVTASFAPEKNDLKGGRYIVDLAKRFSGEKMKILVAANYGDVDSLPDNLLYLGRTKDQTQLAELYSMADLTVIASKRETFSMAAAESLCCGTPVAGFLAGGPESIAIPEYSQFVEYGNGELLCKACKEWLDRKIDRTALSEKAWKLYRTPSIVEKYQKLYRESRGKKQ